MWECHTNNYWVILNVFVIYNVPDNQQYSNNTINCKNSYLNKSIIHKDKGNTTNENNFK